MKIIADKKYPNMYRIQWPGGDLSVDFYNKTRAKDWIRVEEVQNLGGGQEFKRCFNGHK